VQTELGVHAIARTGIRAEPAFGLGAFFDLAPRASDGVFWSETGHAATAADPQVVMGAAKDGSSPVIVTPLSGSPGALALDTGYVYYVQSRTPPPAGYAVFRVGKPGKPPSTRPNYAGFATPAPTPGGLAVDANDVYWIDATRAFAMTKNAAADAWTAVAMGLSGGFDIALDGNHAWVSEQTGSVLLVDLTGAAAPVPIAGSSPSFGVAVDSMRVMWTTGAAVMAAPKSGGSATMVAPCASTCEAVAADGTNVLWATLHEVWEAPAGGGAPRMIGSGYSDVHHIAFDATRVYWTDTASGDVWSSCK
jgi:hypothetical protein